MRKPKKSLANFGLWSTADFPTEPAIKVLAHLLQEGDPSPRLYMQDTGKGSYRCSVSNSASVTGWSTKIDSLGLLRAGLIEIDPEATRKCLPSIKAYRISMRGREALVQVQAHDAYWKLLENKVPSILRELRSAYGVSESEETKRDSHM
jgi:hypothetical protein